MRPLRFSLFTCLVLFACLFTGCAPEPEPASPGTAADDPAAALARPSDVDVTRRVAEATGRLEATEAGRLVLAAIEAHGGLARWYANGPLRFRYRYESLSGGPPIETDQIIDTWSSRARHTLVSDTTVSFGWTGEEAWVAGTDSLSMNARFWSLTPYYFVAMPFVLADPGVHLEAAGQMTVEEQTYDLVHVTFDPGTGDAPDDYYYLLLDPATRRVGGVRYVVSYPGFFPEGGTSPERLMLYDGAQAVSEVTLQQGFRSFAWAAGAGEASASGTVTEVRFAPDAPDALFAMPEGASVQEQM